MLDVELYLSHPRLAFTDRDPNDPLSGWTFIGQRRIIDLPSPGDQICVGPGEVVKVRGIMHLPAMEAAGQSHEPAVRLMVDVVPGPEILGPAR